MVYDLKFYAKKKLKCNLEETKKENIRCSVRKGVEGGETVHYKQLMKVQS
jgi:hypothetical protein